MYQNETYHTACYTYNLLYLQFARKASILSDLRSLHVQKVKTEVVWIKKLVQCKIIRNTGLALCQITYIWRHFSDMETFNQQEPMIFWQFASIGGCV